MSSQDKVNDPNYQTELSHYDMPSDDSDLEELSTSDSDSSYDLEWLLDAKAACSVCKKETTGTIDTETGACEECVDKIKKENQEKRLKEAKEKRKTKSTKKWKGKLKRRTAKKQGLKKGSDSESTDEDEKMEREWRNTPESGEFYLRRHRDQGYYNRGEFVRPKSPYSSSDVPTDFLSSDAASDIEKGTYDQYKDLKLQDKKAAAYRLAERYNRDPDWKAREEQEIEERKEREEKEEELKQILTEIKTTRSVPKGTEDLFRELYPNDDHWSWSTTEWQRQFSDLFDTYPSHRGDDWVPEDFADMGDLERIKQEDMERHRKKRLADREKREKREKKRGKKKSSSGDGSGSGPGPTSRASKKKGGKTRKKTKKGKKKKTRKKRKTRRKKGKGKEKKRSRRVIGTPYASEKEMPLGENLDAYIKSKVFERDTRTKAPRLELPPEIQEEQLIDGPKKSVCKDCNLLGGKKRKTTKRRRR